MQPPWLHYVAYSYRPYRTATRTRTGRRAACRAGFISTCARARSSTGGAELDTRKQCYSLFSVFFRDSFFVLTHENSKN